MDNLYLKIEDQQTMIHSTQKRLEELYDLLKHMDNRVLRMSSFEQAMSAKMDMVIDTLRVMKYSSGARCRSLSCSRSL